MLNLRKSIWLVSMAQSKERNTFIMMITTFISRLLGILKARAISSFFGAGLIADAINFSYNIPNNLRKLFAEGALSQAYLPIFSKLKDDDENTSSFLGALFTFQLIIFIPLIVLSFIFSKPFITLLSGFNDENQIVIAANLLPFFLTFLFFISLSTLLSTVLQTRKAFLITGIGPIFFTLTVILSIYLFTNKLSYYSMALGCTAGSIIQMVSQAIVVKKRKIKLKLSNPLKSKWFILTLKAFIPATLYSFILILDQYLSFYIASMLESGAVSAISNSIIFYQTPYGIFFASISTVFFPLIAGEKDDKIKAKYLNNSLTYLVSFLLPSAIILLTLSEQCISAVLQKGRFTYLDNVLTAKVLKWYLFSMIPLAFSSMLSRYCYSKNDYSYPVIVSLVQAILDVSLMFIFVKLNIGAESISLALLISSTIAVLIYLPKIKLFNYSKFFKEIVRILAANIPLILAASIIFNLKLTYHVNGSNLKAFCITASLGILLVCITLIFYIIFKIPFLSLLKNGAEKTAPSKVN